MARGWKAGEEVAALGIVLGETEVAIYVKSTYVKGHPSTIIYA